MSGHYRQAAKLIADTDADAALVFYLSKADPLLVLRDLLGHSSVLTTEKYLKQGSGIASGERETAGRQVNMAPERRLRSVRDTCLTRTDRHLIASDAGYAHLRGCQDGLAEATAAAAPLPLLGALSAPAGRVGLPTSHVGTKKRCMPQGVLDRHSDSSDIRLCR